MKIIPHHKAVSRPVEPHDIPAVVNDAYGMVLLCRQRNGRHSGGLAVAHSQITEHPLRFFVTADGIAYVNPEIESHGKRIGWCEEGCLSYPELGVTKVTRHKAVIVRAQVFDEKHHDKTGEWRLVPFRAAINGMEAQVWQHEIDHMNGVSVWERV